MGAIKKALQSCLLVDGVIKRALSRQRVSPGVLWYIRPENEHVVTSLIVFIIVQLFAASAELL